MRLGACAIRRIDVVNYISDHLDELVDQLQMSAHVAIWTARATRDPDQHRSAAAWLSMFCKNMSAAAH